MASHYYFLPLFLLFISPSSSQEPTELFFPDFKTLNQIIYHVNVGAVFNFPNGEDDVSKVTRANYDSCNGRNSILMLSNSHQRCGVGSHYFICGFPGHCGVGQKLAINVGSTSSPAPQPSTAAPRPSSMPTPLPSPPASAPTLQVGSTPTVSPSPSTGTPPSSSSPSLSITTSPSSIDSPPSPTNPSTPSPVDDNNHTTPP